VRERRGRGEWWRKKRGHKMDEKEDYRRKV
jgi:hypothetical protein